MSNAKHEAGDLAARHHKVKVTRRIDTDHFNNKELNNFEVSIGGVKIPDGCVRGYSVSELPDKDHDPSMFVVPILTLEIEAYDLEMVIEADGANVEFKTITSD